MNPLIGQIDEIGETWHFTTKPGDAEQVFLAVDGPTMPSRWVEMTEDLAQPGVWRVITRILPGHSRLRYFTVENGTYLNCGSAGLFGERTSLPDPDVQLGRLGLIASA
ncbi:MAG: hypothetical protein ACPGYV_12780 [Phycisphaeraceae bacterium]